MSRLKRQKLTATGVDHVTLSSDESTSFDRGREVPKAEDEQNKQQGRSLFIRSLPAKVTSESLATLFSQSFPLKHATVVVDPATKKSKGYGFVTFADVEDAQKAKETFHHSLLDGQKIKVVLAEPRRRQDNVDGSTNASSKPSKSTREKAESQPQPPPKLIVRNLPWTVKEPDQLASLFRSYGKVKHATMPKKGPGLSAGFGFIVLRGRKNAEKALEGMNGKEIDGRTLAVDWAVEKGIWETLQAGNQQPEAIGVSAEESVQGSDGGAKKILESDGEILDMAVSRSDVSESEDEGSQDTANNDSDSEENSFVQTSESNSSTLFIRNLPFSCTDEILQKLFLSFGAVRYARVVLDSATERSKGTAFVCFYNSEDAENCLKEAPRTQPAAGPGATFNKATGVSFRKHSLLEDISKDVSGRFTIDGRVLSVTRAVDRKEATRLTHVGDNLRTTRDQDKRRLYLLTEGTIPSDSPLYNLLSATEIKMREDSAKQRQSLIKSNPTLHLSLTRLSIRNLPRSLTSKDLKALAREAVVGFAKDVKCGARKQLSKEELARGGEELRDAEKARKAKGKGIVKQAKVIFEGREGGKVAEESGAGRSRGYGFIEYSSHRWALMGLRWLNGHAVDPSKYTGSTPEVQERRKRLITEFSIENAQVVGRRHEREVKARERSKLISEKRAKGEVIKSPAKAFSRNQLMAKTRKGSKRKREPPLNQSTRGDIPIVKIANDSTEKVSKRQQIIGRKRMLRKSRNK